MNKNGYSNSFYIDLDISETYNYIFLKINGKEYYIDKEITDESTGESIITLKDSVIKNQY